MPHTTTHIEEATQDQEQRSALAKVGSAFTPETEAQRQQLRNLFSTFQPIQVGTTSSASAAEINQIPPAVDTSTAVVDAQVAGAGLTATTPTQESFLAELQRIQEQSKKQSEGLRGLLEDKPTTVDADAITKQAFETLGLPADFTKTQFQALQTTNAEILKLNEELARINTQEQQKLTAIEAQPVGTEFISRKQAQTERDFAIRKAGVAAQVEAKAAYAQVLRGDFQMVDQLVNKALDMAVYEKNQEISDWKWMFGNYKDEFDSLTKRERDLFDTTLGLMEQEAKDERQDLKDKMKLYLDNKVPVPSMDRLKSMEFDEVARQVQELTPVGVERLSVSDAKALGVPFGTTVAQAEAMGITPGAVRFDIAGDTASLPKEDQQAIVNRVIASLPDASARDQAFSTVGVFQSGKDMLDLLEKGVSTGPLASVYRQGVSFFGIPIVPGARSFGATSQKENEFDAAATIFTANFIKSISGAQVSDRERQFLMESLPSPGKQKSVNQANIKVLTQFLRNRYETQLGIQFEQFPGVFPNLDSGGKVEETGEAGETTEDYLNSRGF